MEIQYRTINTDYVPEENKIVGYAAKYDSPSEDMWSFLGTYREYIDKGAFDGVLSKKDDVRCLFNHNDDKVLGRTTNNTLTLRADDKGLYFECEIDPEISWQSDLLKSIKRGDINQCSFAFTLDKEDYTDEYDKNSDTYTRHIKGFQRLYDVSVVTYPAYPATEAYARDLKETIEQVKKEQENIQSEKVQVDIDRLTLELDCLL